MDTRDLERHKKLLEESGSAKVIHLAEQFIFPYLQDCIALETNALRHSFHEGRDTTHNVAFISALLRLDEQLKLVLNRGDRSAAKLHAP